MSYIYIFFHSIQIVFGFEEDIILNVTSHAKTFLTASVRTTECTASKRIRNGCIFFFQRQGRAAERMQIFFRTVKSNG